MKRLFTIAGAVCASAAIILPMSATVQAADDATGAVQATMGTAVKWDRTELRAPDLAKLLPVDARQQVGGTTYQVPNQFGEARALPRHDQDSDPLAADGQNPAFSPTPGVSFNGPDSDDNAALFGFRIQPPDTNGDVGRENVVQYINLVWRVFDKAGNPIGGAMEGNTFWAGFGGVCEAENAGDPIVLYDDKAGRWVFTQFAPFDGTQCFAISDGEDPMGPYTRYAFLVEPNAFNDYPKVGLWLSEDGSQSAYTYTGRNFTPQGNPAFARDITAVLFDRDSMLAGVAANFATVPLPGGFVTFDGAQPGHQENGSVAPGDECPLFSVAEAPSTYRFFAFCENFPGGAAFQVLPTVSVPNFDDGLGDVPQPGGDSLDTLAFFTMYRASHNNLLVTNGGHRLAMSHTVDAGGDRAGMRWAILDVNDYFAISLVDTGTHAPNDGYERWMGSVTLDKTGNLGLGYTRGGNGEPTDVYYTGRETTDPAGTVQAEVECVDGGGVQTGGGGRWGDYSSTSLDPVDQCTFWTFQEYVETTGSFQWSQRVCSFSFPSCTGGQPNFTLALSPGQAGAANTWTTTNGTANIRHVFFFGRNAGSTPAPFPVCAGTNIDIASARNFGNDIADGGGSAAISRNIGPGVGGETYLFQALDLGNCDTTNVVTNTF